MSSPERPEPYHVEIEPRARRDLTRLSRNRAYPRISAAIDSLAVQPRPPGVVKLTTRDVWRVRVSDYRVLYEIHDTVRIVAIQRVAHRRDVYDDP